LLRPLLFCIIYLNLEPQIASAELNSGQARIAKILKLIQNSKYSILDLSRSKAQKKGDSFRFNMPFELGLDIGCREYKKRHWATKECLILEAEKYMWQRLISDLSGSDTLVHNNEVPGILKAVRNWLCDQLNMDGTPGPDKLWFYFTDFTSWVDETLHRDGYSSSDIDELSTKEMIKRIKIWVDTNKPLHSH
jgi:hypothetical protein